MDHVFTVALNTTVYLKVKQQNFYRFFFSKSDVNHALAIFCCTVITVVELGSSPDVNKHLPV